MSTNWQIYYFEIFQEQLRQLKEEVKRLSLNDPENYKSNKKTKMLARIVRVIFNEIAINPQDPRFKLGNTLGMKHKTWRRAKDRMPKRCRLFFKFNSNVERVIITWMNNASTLRKRGDKKDVYNVFLAMIKNDEIPSKWEKLNSRSSLSAK